MVVPKHNKVSLIPKILLTLFVCILVPVYWVNYGPTNFLWLSDIGLFLTVFALWLESPLLISIAMVGIFPMEFSWNLDFFIHLLTGYNATRMADYMFDPNYSLFLRGLSLFHVITPALWLWYFFKWGYDTRAFKYALIVVYSAFILSYLLTDPEKNINWVFGPYIHNWPWMPPFAWVVLLMFGFTVLCFWPLHEFFKQYFKQARTTKP